MKYYRPHQHVILGVEKSRLVAYGARPSWYDNVDVELVTENAEKL